MIIHNSLRTHHGGRILVFHTLASKGIFSQYHAIPGDACCWTTDVVRVQEHNRKHTWCMYSRCLEVVLSCLFCQTMEERCVHGVMICRTWISVLLVILLCHGLMGKNLVSQVLHLAGRCMARDHRSYSIFLLTSMKGRKCSTSIADQSFGMCYSTP